MERALQLAERGRGFVEPNPLVGAVVVRGDRAVGEGWHRRFGETHAEVHALAEAGAAAREATLYVTLEPCCHQGKTPPCTDALLRAGIRRVVAAMLDPFPAVAGKGVAILREAGVTVEVGVGQSRARRLNAPYLKLLATGRPYVHLKWAMTLDGKIATRTGESKWISGEGSRARVHALRGRMDALLVGIGTALADDPILTARSPGARTPVRVILDSHGRLSPGTRLVQTARDAPLLVVTTGVPVAGADALRSCGCEVIALAASDGRPSVAAVLHELGRRQMTNILVEGGSQILGSFVDAGEGDEIHVVVAPRLVGGAAAKGATGGRGVERIADALQFMDMEVEMLEGDVLIHGRKRLADEESPD